MLCKLWCLVSSSHRSSVTELDPLREYFINKLRDIFLVKIVEAKLGSQYSRSVCSAVIPPHKLAGTNVTFGSRAEKYLAEQQGHVRKPVLSRIEKEPSLITLAERAQSVCVCLVMTRLDEPVDLTVKNEKSLSTPTILSRKQETKHCRFWMKDMFVCCVCLRARRRYSSAVTEVPCVLIQSSHSWISWRRNRHTNNI